MTSRAGVRTDRSTDGRRLLTLLALPGWRVDGLNEDVVGWVPFSFSEDADDEALPEE